MPSFNTASVLIQQIHHIPLGRVLNCFNTASVLIQLGTVPRGMGKIRVSIQLLFLFNRYCYGSHPSRRRVSIQLLFLFNWERSKDISSKRKFQYSFCSYSTKPYSDEERDLISFNTASVLIQQKIFTAAFAAAICFNTASVLIQR